MGISPNSGDGVERNYTIDGRHDAEGLVSDAEHTGQEAGKAFSQIAAQSDSANNGMAELSRRVSALESATGPDLSGYATISQLAALRRNLCVFTGSTAAGATRINVALTPTTGLPSTWSHSGASVTLPAGTYRVELWLGSSDEMTVSGIPNPVVVTPASATRGERTPAILVTLTSRSALYLRSLPTAGQTFTMLIEQIA